MNRRICLTAVIVILFSLGISQASIIYNLANDWSDTQNPSGLWSLNYNNTAIASHFYSGSQGFWGDYTSQDGSFSKSVSDHTANDWLTGDIAIHTLSTIGGYQGSSVFTNVKWTSPADGTINIYGQAWDAFIQSSRQVGWKITLNGEILAERYGVRGLIRTNTAAQFSNNIISGKSLTGIAVDEDDIIQFTAITRTGSGLTGYGHFLGLNMNVEFIPEPATICILGLGALSFVGRKK